MRYGCMYSGWSPFLSSMFWKKEFVGRGAERRWGEKKREGSGRTVDCVSGKRKAEETIDFLSDGDTGSISGDGDGTGGEGVGL